MSQENDINSLKQAYANEQHKNAALEILFEQKTYELYQVNQQLKQQQRTIIKSEKLASIGRLAAGIAHEINNPLTFVSSNLEILHSIIKENPSYTSDDEVNEIFDDVSEGIKRITSIVKNVNSFSRTKDGERQEFNLNQAILSSLHLIKNRVINKLTLTTDLQDIPNSYGNVNELKQVILNILINAIDALNEKGAAIESALLKITTHLDNNFDHIVLIIEDNGSGIDESKLLNIFDPFYSTKDVGEGSGLGLYVCHEIILAHNGSIDVQSQRHEGTTFTIRLPVKSSLQLD